MNMYLVTLTWTRGRFCSNKSLKFVMYASTFICEISGCNPKGTFFINEACTITLVNHFSMDRSSPFSTDWPNV